MKKHNIAVIAIVGLFLITPMGQAKAQNSNMPPLVYAVERTHTQPTVADISINDMPEVRTLTNPFLFSNGKDEAKSFAQWAHRRAEIAAEIQHYEIGEKPAVPLDSIDARMEGDTLFVTVHAGGQTLNLQTVIRYPRGGTAPYPLMIGASMNALPARFFTERNIATAVFQERQVNGYSQMGRAAGRGNYPFDRLYPQLTDNGAYSEWAWGFSRLLDGLQKLGTEVTRIDLSHIGVTGCSYAGKMALYCGAFDERVALVISQEPGGGGAAAWRVSETLGNVETLEKTDYNWFKQSLKDNFSNEALYRLPHDHHELVALVCPRAVLLLGNPDYEWLADPSMYVSANAAIRVWERYGIGDRIGYSIVAGHGHCQLPASQYPEVEAFLDRFLLGKEANTAVRVAPDDYAEKYNPLPWMKW